MGTEKRLALFPFTPVLSILEMEEWWQGWEARTRNPRLPSSEDVGWDTLGRTGPAWITDAHGSQRQGLLPSRSHTAVEKEEGFSALELHPVWSFLCAAMQPRKTLAALYLLLYGQ